MLSFLFILSFSACAAFGLLAVSEKHPLNPARIYAISVIAWSYQFFIAGTSDLDYLNRLGSIYRDELLLYSAALAVSGLLYFYFRTWNFSLGAMHDHHNVHKYHLTQRVLVYTLLSTTVFLTDTSDTANLLGSILVFIIKPIYYVSASALEYVLFRERHTKRAILISLATVLVSTSTVQNRTHALIPIIGAITAYYASKPSSHRMNSKALAITILSIALLSLFADYQKQTHFSLLKSTLGEQQEIIYNSYVSSNYSASQASLNTYLNVIHDILNTEGYKPGSWFLQLCTIAIPRFVYPEKPEFDLSKTYFELGYLEHNLYYDFLYDKIVDSGLVGVIAYSILYMLIVKIAIRLASKFMLTKLHPEGVGFISISLSTLFLVTRGPIILIAFFLVGPMIVFGLAATLRKALYAEISNPHGESL
jgi:hypothetical protein